MQKGGDGRQAVLVTTEIGSSYPFGAVKFVGRQGHEVHRRVLYADGQFPGDLGSVRVGLLSVIVHSSTFDNERFIQKTSGQYAFSSGSACTAGEPSHVLQAIGRSGETSRILRISLSETWTPPGGFSLTERVLLFAVSVVCFLLAASFYMVVDMGVAPYDAVPHSWRQRL